MGYSAPGGAACARMRPSMAGGLLASPRHPASFTVLFGLMAALSVLTRLVNLPAMPRRTPRHAARPRGPAARAPVTPVFACYLVLATALQFAGYGQTSSGLPGPPRCSACRRARSAPRWRSIPASSCSPHRSPAESAPAARSPHPRPGRGPVGRVLGPGHARRGRVPSRAGHDRRHRLLRGLL